MSYSVVHKYGIHGLKNDETGKEYYFPSLNIREVINLKQMFEEIKN